MRKEIINAITNAWQEIALAQWKISEANYNFWHKRLVNDYPRKNKSVKRTIRKRA